MLITAGERKAIALMCMALHDRECQLTRSREEAGFLTDTNHQNAKILTIDPQRVQEAVDAGRVAVVAGSQGVSTDNNVTFLGRGAQTQLRLLAHALNADACELYTDVQGSLQQIQKSVNKQKMPSISFDELQK